MGNRGEYRISWGWTIIISLAWMLLVYLSSVFFIFQNDKKNYGLGMVVYCFLVMIIPVIIFVFTNIMCWVKEVNETSYWVIMGVLSGIFIGGPVLYGAGICICVMPRKYRPEKDEIMFFASALSVYGMLRPVEERLLNPGKAESDEEETGRSAAGYQY